MLLHVILILSFCIYVCCIYCAYVLTMASFWF